MRWIARRSLFLRWRPRCMKCVALVASTGTAYALWVSFVYVEVFGFTNPWAALGALVALWFPVDAWLTGRVDRAHHTGHPGWRPLGR